MAHRIFVQLQADGLAYGDRKPSSSVEEHFFRQLRRQIALVRSGSKS
jgi:hypothetical protein